MCTRQSRKVIWDMINTLFLTLQLSNLLLLLFFSTRKHTSMTSRTILSNFFEEQWTQNRPTIPLRIVACTFSDNLSRNSCKPLIMTTLRVPFDACYADSENCDSLESHSLEGGGGGEWVMKDKIFLHHEYLYCFTSLLQCRHAMLLPTSPQLWEGALRDDTKNGCVVADYTFTNSIQN